MQAILEGRRRAVAQNETAAPGGAAARQRLVKALRLLVAAAPDCQPPVAVPDVVEAGVAGIDVDAVVL
jgi:hypothetical protein